MAACAGDAGVACAGDAVAACAGDAGVACAGDAGVACAGDAGTCEEATIGFASGAPVAGCAAETIGVVRGGVSMGNHDGDDASWAARMVVDTFGSPSAAAVVWPCPDVGKSRPAAALWSPLILTDSQCCTGSSLGTARDTVDSCCVEASCRSRGGLERRSASDSAIAR